MRRWFDAHLDLAYLAVSGRDMARTLRDLLKPKHLAGAEPHPPASITLPALRDGGVTDVLGTIFTEVGGEGPSAYPPGDLPAANEAGLRQLRCYHNWVHDAGVRLSRFDNHEGASQRDPDAEPGAYRGTTKTHTEQTIHVGILMENADPIPSPDELPWWVERGVVAIGLTWARPSRYAGGNATTTGLTDLGRAMVDAMDDLSVVHDLSHLSQKATDDVLERARGPVIASHSNCRELLGGEDERHLADDTIKEVARRGGVIGLNLCAPFVRHTIADGERPSIDDALRHVERICELTGSKAHVGLGSDLDGGFSAEHLPEGIDRPADFEKLAQGLALRGWSEDEQNAFAHGNWLAFFKRVAAQRSA